MSKANEERNAAIVKARLKGTHSLGELAEIHNITRERARQIAKEGGVDPDKANIAYAKRIADREFDRAQEHAGTILMLYIAGKSHKEIADQIGCQTTSVREVLDEQLTDEVAAARSAGQTARMFPDAQNGPKENAPERSDRFWTPEKVRDALIVFAREQGGRLPSSTQYQKLAPKRDDLPSFATIRNRLGRWSDIRVDVNRAAR